MKQRIWELDAFRGFCILGMVLVHLIWDLAFFGITQGCGPIFSFVQRWGGIAFFVLSGICVRLSRHPAQRGAQVLACGVLITLATTAAYRLGFTAKDGIIPFGVLHCLGTCMVLWKMLRSVSAVHCLGLILLGFFAENLHPDTYLLLPLGFTPASFASVDYFPLLPYLGYFLFGSLLGQRLYRLPVTRFPGVDASQGFLRFLCLCGRHSLPIYLLHQPILTALLWLACKGGPL